MVSRKSSKAVKIAVIPDTQVRPGVSTAYLDWIAQYLKEKKPDYTVHLGDHWDLPSLSSYDRGKRAAENRRVYKDIEAGNQALRKLGGIPGWKCLLRGNHEQRLERYIEDHAELDGVLSLDGLDSAGWQVAPFLQVVNIAGIAFSHYFPRGPGGRITQTRQGAPNAKAMIQREMRSCIAGHLQGLDTAIMHTGNRTVRGIIAGSCYLHDESYLSPQGNNHWRGILLLHEAYQGDFNLCEVSLKYLERRYG